jgi:hypothetical protein
MPTNTRKWLWRSSASMALLTSNAKTLFVFGLDREIDPKHQRLEAVIGLIEKTSRKIARYVIELGDAEDETIRASIRAEMRNTARQKEAWEVEQQLLEDEIRRKEITPVVQANILQTAAEIRGKLEGATYKQKRLMLDFFDVKVIFLYTDNGRWLDVDCKLPVSHQTISLDRIESMSSRN